MTTSQLIAAAQKSFDQYGDLPVKVSASCGDGTITDEPFNTEDSFGAFVIETNLLCSEDMN